MRVILTLIAFSLGWSVHSQTNVGFALIDSIEVIKNGETLSTAWAGGLNNPQFSAVDVQGTNGELELFVYDRDGSLRKGFKYNSNTGKYDWIRRIPGSNEPFQNLFPKVEDRSFCLLRDYDQDGNMDVFSGANFDKIQVHRNTGNFDYTLVKEQLNFSQGANQNSIRMVKNALPVIKDLDGDDDLDLMYFPVNVSPFNCNSFVSFLNQSQEEYGSSDSLEFTVGSYCWGKIKVGTGSGNEFFQFEEYECGPNSCQEAAARDGDVTMTQNIHDMNGDGTFDFLATYDHNDELFFAPNFGDNISGDLDLTQTDFSFPSNDIKVELSNQPYPYFIDVDLDGDDDMLIGSNHITSANSNENDTSGTIITDAFYENVGSNSSPTFELHTQGFLSGEMIDVGMQSMPAFCDLNGDSLLDIVVGNIGYNSFRMGLSGARLAYYKNIGTSGNPIYQFETFNMYGLSSLELRSAHPAFADLDNDGDQDMVIGDHTGHLQYYENTGTPNTHVFVVLTPNFEFIDVGGTAHPQFFDLNNDGLLDLVIGDEYGRIRYYENQGTETNPNFPANPTIETLGGIDVFTQYGGQAVPFFTRAVDSTSQLYLFLGTASGQINVYGPIENFSNTYELADSIVVEATNTSVAGANLLGGYRTELMIGQKAGGLYLMQKDNDLGVGINPIYREGSNLDIYPNPAQEFAHVECDLQGIKDANLAVTSISGQQVYLTHITSRGNGQFRQKIDLSSFPKGVYIVSITTSEGSSWAKLIKE